MTGTCAARRAVVGVGALIIRPDGHALFGHRIKAGEPESWCLPGGHLEAGESFEAAAIREIAEETGIRDVQDLSVFAVLLDTSAGTPHVTACLAGRAAAAGGQVVNREPHVFDRWAWMLPDRALTPLFPASSALLDVWLGRPTRTTWVPYRTADSEPNGGEA